MHHGYNLLRPANHRPPEYSAGEIFGQNSPRGPKMGADSTGQHAQNRGIFLPNICANIPGASNIITLVCSALYLSHVCLACSATELLALAERTTSGNSSLPSMCTSPPRDNCSFYQAYLEPHDHCGPSLTPLDPEQNTVWRFLPIWTKFSPRGQEWVLDTMQCLWRACSRGGGAVPGCEYRDVRRVGGLSAFDASCALYR